MKFVLETLTKGMPRLGKLKEIERLPLAEIETPMPMLYTRGGSIPHITNEVRRLLGPLSASQVIQVPLATTYHYGDVLPQFRGTIAEFVGMQDCVTCLTLHDPGDLLQPGHSLRARIPLWTRTGKVVLTSENYMEKVKAFQPDMYYLMYDGDTNITSSSKRITNSVENTKLFIDDCSRIHQSTPELRDAFVLVPIIGGYCMPTRKKYIERVLESEKPLHGLRYGGFVFDGFHNNGPEVEFLPFAEIEKVTAFTIANLPADKLRIVQGCWNPVAVLQLVKLGMDMFDTSYCNLVTERSSALTFSFDKVGEYEMNLRDTRYADDFAPILESCDCLACQKHSRSYVHHLLTVQELLGPLLLTIHNNHHYLRFFERIRAAIKADTLSNLQEVVKAQFDQHESIISKESEAVSTG